MGGSWWWYVPARVRPEWGRTQVQIESIKETEEEGRMPQKSSQRPPTFGLDVGGVIVDRAADAEVFESDMVGCLNSAHRFNVVFRKGAS